MSSEDESNLPRSHLSEENFTDNDDEREWVSLDREFIPVKNRDLEPNFKRNKQKLVHCREWDINPQYIDSNDFISDGLNVGMDEYLKLFPDFSTIQVRFRVIMRKITSLLEDDESSNSDFWIQMLEVDRPNYTLFPQEFEEWRNNLFTKALERIQTHENVGSNWTFKGVDFLGIIYGKLIVDGKKFKPTQKKVGNWVPIPKNLPGCRFLYNLKTNKNCFNTCIATWFCESLFPYKSSNARKISIIHGNWNKFNFPNLEKQGYISLNSFKIYEKQYNIDIIVYQVYDNNSPDKKFQISIVRKGEKPDLPENRRIYLVLINHTEHIVLVKKGKIESFIRNIRNAYKSPRDNEHCIYCFRGMNKSKVADHKLFCYNQKGVRNIKLPQKGDVYEFKKYSGLLPAPIIIVADTETIQRKTNDGIKNVVFTHDLVSYGFNVLCNEKITFSEIKTGSDPKALCRQFVHSMFNAARACYDEQKKKWYPTATLTSADRESFKNQLGCTICKKVFDDSLDKHAHHDWTKKPVHRNGICIEGNYQYALCRRCNTSLTQKQRIFPVIMHNAGKFDNKFVIAGLGNDYEVRENSIIPKSGETFIQFCVQEKNLPKHKKRFQLKFIDSINFLSGSLETLVNSMKTHGNSFNILEEGLNQRGFKDPELLKLLTQKCYFPYEYIDSYEKLSETELPHISSFNSILSNSSITPDQYNFAQKMFDLGKCSNLLDFLELYLLVDILLLSEVISNFRKICTNVYKLDPCAMATTPSPAMESALLTTNFQLI